MDDYELALLLEVEEASSSRDRAIEYLVNFKEMSILEATYFIDKWFVDWRI